MPDTWKIKRRLRHINWFWVTNCRTTRQFYHHPIQLITFHTLLARLRAVLRIRQAEFAEEPMILNFTDMTIHPRCHQVLVQSAPVDLTASEFRLLHMMALKPGWVFTRSQIVSSLHGDNYAVSDRAIDVHIVTLRKKLGHAARYIETVRGVGYRFKE
jgi:two-component system alkaline phosphatase synthesis response regulator PhoP